MDRLSDADLIVFGGSRDLFTTAEFKDLKQFLLNGGRAMVLIGDGGEAASGSNINYFLEDFGVSVNNDSVTRSAFYKYYHPKEVFIADGLLVPDVARKKNIVQFGGGKKNTNNNNNSMGGGNSNPTSAKEKTSSANGNNNNSNGSNKETKMNLVYPYGASLNVQRPAIPFLSSGPISYPMHRPIAALWEAETVQGAGNQRGRLVVFGSVEIFGDDWLDKEENAKMCDLLTAWLLGEAEIDLTSDRNEAEIADYRPIPNLEALSDVLKPCLQAMDPLPRDFTKLFDLEMFRFGFHLVPQALKLYEQLGVVHEPLTLIPPQFDCPLPHLGIATFPPAMREPAPPALDQFDLDDHFAKEGIRLAQLTNKCTGGEEDLEYYIAEAGEILGVSQALPFGERSAKHILFAIFRTIVDCKKQEFTKPSDYSSTGMQGNVGSGVGGPVPGFDQITTLDGKVDNRQADFLAPTHIAHVDLAPIAGSNRTGNLMVRHHLSRPFYIYPTLY